MTSRKSTLLAGTLFTGVVLAATATLAQTAPPPPTSPAASTAVDELIVTGSRIRRNEYTSDAPITVVTSDQAVLQGLVDTATLLQSQPIASGSGQVNTLLTGFVADGGPGAQTISLRGLGSNRTLVLLNGRRLGPAGVRGAVGAVDLNVIPNSIVDRTEILKDGASSIYGSDAVAGVVNMITKTRLDGGVISAYSIQPFDTGGDEFGINGAWGKTFERGFVSIAGDYNEQKVLRTQDRDYLSCSEDLVFDPATRTRLDYIDPLTNKFKCFNALNNSAQVASTYGGVFQYAVPGVTYPTAAQGNNIAATFPGLAAMGFVRAGRATLNATQPYTNYDTPLYARSSAMSPYKRYSVFASGGFDLTPTIEVYGDLLLNRRESEQYQFQQLFPTVAAGNPNNPFVDVTGTRFAALPIIAVPLDQSQRVDYVRGVGGARGKLGDLPFIGGWDWDIYGQYSKSDARYETDFTYYDRLIATTAFNTACNQAFITDSPPVSCISIPYFSSRVLAGNFNQTEKDFLFGRAVGHTEYKQIAAEGSITGDLFTLPAGSVAAALGFSIRRDEINDQPDPQETIGNMYNLSSATPTVGKDTVREVFGEATAPVFKDMGMFGDLTVTGSARYTDYDSYGSNTTYKVGFNWQVMPAFRVRGTYGTSFRAPALYELFIGDQTSFLGQTSVDPCIRYENSANDRIRRNCAASGVPVGYSGGGSGVTITTGGGVGRLTAETSKASTIGVIFTPKFATFDLSLAVDYFEIKVDDEVRRFGASNIVAQCYLSDNFPNDPLCGLFTRDPSTSAIIDVNDTYVNVAKQNNRGIDLNLRYKQEFSFGTFTVDGQFTWQLEDTTQLLGESEPEDYNGSTVEPDFTGQTQVRYDRGDWTLFWAMDIFSKASDSDLFLLDNTDVHPSTRYNRNVYYKQYTEFQVYHAVSVRKKFDKFTATVGIRNLFDEAPPALSGNEGYRVGYSALPNFDFLGRRAFIQIEKRF